MPRRRSAGLQVRAEWDSLLRALQDRTATIASLEENFSEMKIEQVRNSFVRVSAFLVRVTVPVALPSFLTGSTAAMGLSPHR